MPVIFFSSTVRLLTKLGVLLKHSDSVATWYFSVLIAFRYFVIEMWQDIISGVRLK